MTRSSHFLSMSCHAAAQCHQAQAAAAAQQPAFQAVPQDQPQAEADQAAAPQMIFPAHKKTPPAFTLCRGCEIVAYGKETLSAAQVSLLDGIRAGKLRTGAAEGDAAGFQNVGTVGNL